MRRKKACIYKSRLWSRGLAPYAVTIGFRTWLGAVVLTGFADCGLARPARFNTGRRSHPKKCLGKVKLHGGAPHPIFPLPRRHHCHFIDMDGVEGRHPRHPARPVHVVGFIFQIICGLGSGNDAHDTDNDPRGSIDTESKPSHHLCLNSVLRPPGLRDIPVQGVRSVAIGRPNGRERS